MPYSICNLNPISGGGEYVEIVSDGVKTKGQLLDELYSIADFSKLTDRAVLKFFDAMYRYSYEGGGWYWFTYSLGHSGGISVSSAIIKPSGGSQMMAAIAPAGAANYIQDQSSAVEATGHTIRLYY